MAESTIVHSKQWSTLQKRVVITHTENTDYVKIFIYRIQHDWINISELPELIKLLQQVKKETK